MLQKTKIQNKEMTEERLEILRRVTHSLKSSLRANSGLMHLAAAAEIATLGLFGPSRESNYKPWGSNSFFIRTKKSYEELVLTKDYNRFDNTSLMESLEVEDVYKKCLMILSKIKKN